MRHIYGIQFINENGDKFGSTIIFTSKDKAIKFALRRKGLAYATRVWLVEYKEDKTDEWNDGAQYAHIIKDKRLW